MHHSMQSIYAISDKVQTVAIAIALATPLLIGFWVNTINQEMFGSSLLAVTFGVPFFLYLTAGVLRFVASPGPVTRDRLAGAACGYLLIGYTAGGIFGIIEHFYPGSIIFAELIEYDQVINWGNLIYFSFVTLTTLGYGDMRPIHPTARSFALFVSIVGLMYIAFIISSLVGAHKRHVSDRSE